MTTIDTLQQRLPGRGDEEDQQQRRRSNESSSSEQVEQQQQEQDDDDTNNDNNDDGDSDSYHDTNAEEENLEEDGNENNEGLNVRPPVVEVNGADADGRRPGGEEGEGLLNNNRETGVRQSCILRATRIVIANILIITAVIGWVLFFTFFGLYIYERTKSVGGELIRVPVILRLAIKDYDINPNYKRMYISGSDVQVSGDGKKADVSWTNQNGFWYLEVSPIRSTAKDCPVQVKGIYTSSNLNSEEGLSTIDNPANTSSCNLYDFRVVIYNDLDDGATVHFHGLTPPSNQDGVPSVANANIHPNNLQFYRFNQFTYPGMHWMHAHTGFQQAFGVAAPIILSHSDEYHNANKFLREDDLVVMLEEGFIYPHCAYSAKGWYLNECKNSTLEKDSGKLAFLINRGEKPLEHTPDFEDGVDKLMRIRFLNGGSEAPWRITDAYSRYGNVDMEILATDGQDVLREEKYRREFVLGLANRIDVLIKVNGDQDYVITAVQMMHRGNVKNPALRHIVIRGKNEEKKINATELLPFGTEANLYSKKLQNFDLFESLTAAHPHSDRKVTKTFTVVNRGGDQFGGFPLSIYRGQHLSVPKPGSDEDKRYNLYPVKTYTELNQLKFQLPPYKVYRNDSGYEISTRRNCKDCAIGPYNSSGIRDRPGTDYEIEYKEAEVKGDDKCCWEWCDVPERDCENFKLVDVNEYRTNKNYIPVCYGDRVRILFINTASFEGSEGHPMHLHGHDFTLTALYDIKGDTLTEKNPRKLQALENPTFRITGPKVDTIWVPYNQAVAFEFDAYNAGEHLFHCHNDFHLENGMMTTIRYMHDDTCANSLPKFTGGTNEYPQQFCSMDNCTPEKEEL